MSATPPKPNSTCNEEKQYLSDNRKREIKIVSEGSKSNVAGDKIELIKLLPGHVKIKSLQRSRK